jgi:hypothetical protein
MGCTLTPLPNASDDDVDPCGRPTSDTAMHENGGDAPLAEIGLRNNARADATRHLRAGHDERMLSSGGRRAPMDFK